MDENKNIQKEVNGCAVAVTFSKTKNPGLKNNLLWHLTRCYEDRIESEALEYAESRSKGQAN